MTDINCNLKKGTGNKSGTSNLTDADSTPILSVGASSSTDSNKRHQRQKQLPVSMFLKSMLRTNFMTFTILKTAATISSAQTLSKMLHKMIVPVLFATLAVGCSTAPPVEQIIEGRKVDYSREEYQDGRELQYPPDVIAAEQAKADTQLLSEYRIQAVPDIISAPDEVEIAPARRVVYRRDGNLRWIDLDLPAVDSWNLARGFWQELDFELSREDPETGSLETEWLDLRQGLASTGLGAFVDEILNRVRDSGERDKFITRVEADGDASSIFISHRHISAQFDREGLFSGYTPLPPDSQLESEMLRRMMIYAAKEPEGLLPEEEAFAEEIAEAEEEGSDDYELLETELEIRKPFRESWLLVRIGLDRGGFTIEDQDHVERAYYIQHSGGPESQQIFGKAETNFFNKLFGEQKPILRELKLSLTEDVERNSTVVTVAAHDDEGELTDVQQSVLLELLSVNLP